MNKNIDRVLKEDDRLRPGHSCDLTEYKSVLLLSPPSSEIESYFWKSIEKYSDPAMIRGAMQRTFAKRIRKSLLLSLHCAENAGLPLSTEAIEATQRLPMIRDIPRTRFWAEKLWAEEVVRKGHAMIKDRFVECDK